MNTEELKIAIRYALDGGDMVKAQQLMDQLKKQGSDTAETFKEMGNKARGAFQVAQGGSKLLQGDLSGLNAVTEGLGKSMGKFGLAFGGVLAGGAVGLKLIRDLATFLGDVSVNAHKAAQETEGFAKQNRLAAESSELFAKHSATLKDRLADLEKEKLEGPIRAAKEMADELERAVAAADKLSAKYDELSKSEADLARARLRLQVAKGEVGPKAAGAMERQIQDDLETERIAKARSKANEELAGGRIDQKEYDARMRTLDQQQQAMSVNRLAASLEAQKRGSSSGGPAASAGPATRALAGVDQGIQQAQERGDSSRLKELLKRRASLAADAAVEGMPEGPNRVEFRDGVLRDEGRKISRMWNQEQASAGYTAQVEGGERPYKFITDPREVKPWTPRKKVRVRDRTGQMRDEWKPIAFMPFAGMGFDRSGGVGRSGPASNARFGRAGFDAPVGYSGQDMGAGASGGADEAMEAAVADIVGAATHTNMNGAVSQLGGELKERAKAAIEQAVRNSFKQGGEAVLAALAGLSVNLTGGMVEMARDIDRLQRQVKAQR